MTRVLLGVWLVWPAAAQVIAGGVVNWATGEPVAQVRLRLHGKTDRFAVSDAGGRFQFPGVQPGPYSLLAIRAGFLSEQRNLTLTSDAGLPDVRLPLSPQAVISGLVVDADGWPVRGAGVRVLREGAGPESPLAGFTYTDDLGRFRVTRLAGGRYYLRVFPYDLKNWDTRYANAEYPAGGAPDSQALAVGAGQELGGLSIRLSNPDGVTVDGHVHIPSGVRIPPGFTLRPVLERESSGDSYPCGTCGPEGAFVFRHIPPGWYWLRFPQPPEGRANWGYWSGATRRLEVGGADVSGVNLVLAPDDPHDLRGSVVSGDPRLRARARLILTRLGLSTPEPATIGFSEADGTFLFEGIQPGRYRLEAAPLPLVGPWPWGVVTRLEDTDLPGGEFAFDGASTPLRVELIPATAGLSVEVTGSGGGVWDAAIHVAPVNSAVRLKAGGATDQNGGFEGLLPPGEYRVWAEAEGLGAAAPQTVRLAAGANPPLRFEMAGRAASR